MAGKGSTSGPAVDFQFEERDKVFRCFTDAPKAPASARSKHWWWFQVSGDESKYAPFKAAPDDTEASVRSRVIQYYFERLARRSEPSRPFGGGRRPAPAATTTAAPAAPSTPEQS